MFSFDKIRRFAAKFLNPSLYMGGLDFVLNIWRNSEPKDRGILLLVFIPMFVSMGGFIFTIIYFVLFVLPSYLFSFLGWGLLTALFGAGGKYCFKHFTGKEIPTGNSNIIDAEYIESQESEEPSAKTTRRKSNAR